MLSGHDDINTEQGNETFMSFLLLLLMTSLAYYIYEWKDKFHDNFNDTSSSSTVSEL